MAMTPAFFDAVRASLFGGALTQQQVQGIETTARAWAKYGDGDLRKLAYVLATKKWETGHTMQPVTENLNYTSAARIAKVWPSRFPSVASAKPYVRNPQKLANSVYANRNGNGDEASGDGWRYRGMGDTQITGKENFARAGKKLGIDLVGKPQLACEPETAAAIQCLGMMEGWFTGRDLHDYFTSTGGDWVGARMIVNGKDSAAEIAEIAQAFYTALIAGKAAEPVKPAPTPTAPAKPVPPAGDIPLSPTASSRRGIGLGNWLIILALIGIVIVLVTFWRF